MIAVWLGLLSAVGALVAAAALALFSSRLAGSRLRLASLLVPAALGAAATAICWATGLTGVPAPFLAPLVGLGAFFATAVTMPHRAADVGLVRTAVFAGIMTLLVFVPAAVLVWAEWYDPFATGIGYIDFGAALAVDVPSGAAVLAVLLLERRTQQPELVPVRGWRILWPVLVLWAGWIGLLIGLELAIDRLTPTILANALIMPAAGALAVAVVDRARLRSNSWGGIALGLLAGTAAATASVGYVIPLLGALIGVLAGALSALLPHAPITKISGTLLVSGATSLILLGFLAKDVSFIYTGQPEVFFGQALTALLGAISGFVVGLVVWSILRTRRS